jgi:hypothetical protein
LASLEAEIKVKLLANDTEKRSFHGIKNNLGFYRIYSSSVNYIKNGSKINWYKVREFLH